ncbi:MAG: DUF7487 domain-containing protein [Nitrosopumilaceae archaeon]
MALKLTQEKFIERATRIHGHYYDYRDTLYINDRSKVIIICNKHGVFKQTPNSHYSGSGCPVCGAENRKQTVFQKYGVENPSQSEEIKQKKKQIWLHKYGVENPSQSEEIKQKKKQTSVENYGVEYPWMSKEIQERRKQIWLHKYGVENPSQSEEIRKKIKQTWLDKYKAKHPAQRHMHDILPLVENYFWLYDEYINKRKSTTRIGNELNISDVCVGTYLKKHDISTKGRAGFSYIAIMWLESIMQKQNTFIQHALNVGEYIIPTTRLHVDGYCEEINTIYEFHGNLWHGNPEVFEFDYYIDFLDATAGELYQRTIERENLIKSLGYNLVVMWENQYIF